MAGRDGGTDAGPSEGRGSLSTSQLPWGQIPSFVAGESDLEDYAKKLIFLRSIWPEEHIAHLAPRAALQCDAVSFKKVSKIDPERLKSKEGCDALLTALGVQWGRFQNEDRYLKFERALFLTTQKPDESNDSYIARHEASFEEILQKDKSVSLEEIRAYVMIRHSQLTGEEKKRNIVDNKGILTYDSTRDAMRLLGSRFFQDLQGAGGKKWKTYDAHTVEESEPVFTSVDEGVDEEQVYQTLLEQGDEDAVFIQEFDEQIIEAVQDSGELASCFLSYQEARAKLRERARNRGFGPPRGSGKGKSFGEKEHHFRPLAAPLQRGLPTRPAGFAESQAIGRGNVHSDLIVPIVPPRWQPWLKSLRSSTTRNSQKTCRMRSRRVQNSVPHVCLTKKRLGVV